MRAKARLYVPHTAVELLTEFVIAERFALCLDTDALLRSPHARPDRVMLSAINALARMNVQLALIARHDRERAEGLRDALPDAWCPPDGLATDALAIVRERIPGAPLLAISDDRGVLGALSALDRGIALCADRAGMGPHIVAAAELNIRAALWWIVDLRWRQSRAAW
jgi:hypothetical protein